MSVVIFHNPVCGTSRNTLGIIRASGEEPTVIEYMKTGWTKPQLLALFATAGLTPKQALRTNKGRAEELGLTGDDVTDEQILDAMIENPVLVNRPIVATPKGIRMCRPAETVLEILENTDLGDFRKENGEPVKPLS